MVGDASVTTGKRASAFLGKRYTDPFRELGASWHEHYGKEIELSQVLEHNTTLSWGSENCFIRIEHNLACADGSR